MTVAGSVFRIISASGPVKIATGDITPNAEHSQGTGERVASGFNKLRLLSASTQDVEILIGDGDLYDSRLSLSAPVELATGTAVAVSAANVAVTASAIIAADSARRSLFIYNNSATVTCFIGPASVTAGNGWPLAPKSGIAMDRAPGAAVYGCTSAGTAEVRTLSEV